MNEAILNKELENSNSTTPRISPVTGVVPTGRPKGSKNRITAQKLKIEESLRDQLNEYMPQVVQKVIELALKGDRQMLRLLMELTVSKAQAMEDTSGGKDQVKITIGKINLNQPVKEPIAIEGRVIDHVEE